MAAASKVIENKSGGSAQGGVRAVHDAAKHVTSLIVKVIQEHSDSQEHSASEQSQRAVCCML